MQRMLAQPLVLPRTAPVPPVLPGERAYHAQPCRLPLPPQLRIARPPRIVCPQPYLSIQLARHPHIRLLTGLHPLRVVPVTLPSFDSAIAEATPLVFRSASHVPQPPLVLGHRLAAYVTPFQVGGGRHREGVHRMSGTAGLSVLPSLMPATLPATPPTTSTSACVRACVRALIEMSTGSYPPYYHAPPGADVRLGGGTRA